MNGQKILLASLIVAAAGTVAVLLPGTFLRGNKETPMQVEVFDESFNAEVETAGMKADLLTSQPGTRSEVPASRQQKDLFVPKPPPQNQGLLPPAAIKDRMEAIRLAIKGSRESWLPRLMKRIPKPSELPTAQLFRMFSEPWALPLQELVWEYTVAQAKAKIAEQEATLEILKRNRYWTLREDDFRKRVWPDYNKLGALVMGGRHRNADGAIVVLIIFVPSNATAKMTATAAQAKRAERAVWAALAERFNALEGVERERILTRFHQIHSTVRPSRPATAAEKAFASRFEFLFVCPRYVQFDLTGHRILLAGQ